MSERYVRRPAARALTPWTPAQDHALTLAVNLYGGGAVAWHDVGVMCGRTWKACRERMRKLRLTPEQTLARLRLERERDRDRARRGRRGRRRTIGVELQPDRETLERLLLERDRRVQLDLRSDASVLMGEPITGRSALDLLRERNRLRLVKK